VIKTDPFKVVDPLTPLPVVFESPLPPLVTSIPVTDPVVIFIYGMKDSQNQLIFASYF